jgi:hypothetical protein
MTLKSMNPDQYLDSNGPHENGRFGRGNPSTPSPHESPLVSGLKRPSKVRIPISI